MVKIFIGVLIVTVIVIAGFMILDPKINLVNTNNATTLVVDGENGSLLSFDGPTYKVGVEGSVQKEGTYTLLEGSTMRDLIQSAGGLSSGADERAFYQESVLEGGMTYYIPNIYNASDVCNREAITKVNINDDSSDKLSTINGISVSIASSIVSYRNANGSFKYIEDLLNVYGIGNATYKKIRDYVILHEWSCYYS